MIRKIPDVVCTGVMCIALFIYFQNLLLNVLLVVFTPSFVLACLCIVVPKKSCVSLFFIFTPSFIPSSDRASTKLFLRPV